MLFREHSYFTENAIGILLHAADFLNYCIDPISDCMYPKIYYRIVVKI